MPRAPMTSMFEGQPTQNKAFSYQNKGHLSHEKNPYYFPLYWLVNRDPYNGLL